MAAGWHGRQRRTVAVARVTVLLSLSVFPLLLGGCTRLRHETTLTGWGLNGVAVSSGNAITISPATEELELRVVFPDGYGPADEFHQTATLSVLGGEPGRTVELAPEGGTLLPIPPGLQSTLTLSLGFCAVRDKETCFIDRPTIRITRSRDAGADRNLIVHYAPETPR